MIAIKIATGIDKLNTNEFQLERKAAPGSAKKLMLLTNVANMESPIAHAGNVPPPVE